MAEVECFGVDYERYALCRCLENIVKNYGLTNCLEVPAVGAKAMPSIYSLGLAKAGSKVTLVNPSDSAVNSWKAVNLSDRLAMSNQSDIHCMGFPDNSFDFVWNFAYLPLDEDPAKLIQEMKRVSSKYVAIFSVNGRNSGAYIHRFLHKLFKVPWTHGRVDFNFPNKVAKFVEDQDLKIIKKGVVDCPFWPDSLGFRDMRLHRKKIKEMTTEWESNTLKYMAEKKYPAWIHLVYAFESIPMPLLIKYLYAHIFYIIGEKP